MYKCWYCGCEVSWSGDFMESELCVGDIPEEFDRVVGHYHCSHCGSDYAFYQGEGWVGDDEKDVYGSSAD